MESETFGFLARPKTCDQMPLYLLEVRRKEQQGPEDHA